MSRKRAKEVVGISGVIALRRAVEPVINDAAITCRSASGSNAGWVSTYAAYSKFRE